MGPVQLLVPLLEDEAQDEDEDERPREEGDVAGEGPEVVVVEAAGEGPEEAAAEGGGAAGEGASARGGGGGGGGGGAGGAPSLAALAEVRCGRGLEATQADDATAPCQKEKKKERKRQLLVTQGCGLMAGAPSVCFSWPALPLPHSSWRRNSAGCWPVGAGRCATAPPLPYAPTPPASRAGTCSCRYERHTGCHTISTSPHDTFQPLHGA
jgi:hypothetical protein